MSDTLSAEAVPDTRPASPLSLANLLASAVFAVAAIVFSLYYVFEYTIWWSGHLNHVLFGLWGLYWGVALAWGALRIRPREKRRGIYHALLWAAFAQGFFLTLFWGVGLLGPDAQETAKDAMKAIGYSGFAAGLAGPLLAVGFLFTSRRRLVLVLAEILGPALFWALNRWGG